MPYDTLRSENAAAQQHTNIPCGSKQHHGSHEKVHADGDAAG
jgi:hypothetical protein